ncbi:Mismatch repair protein msh3 [Ascosphaera pollenicola]|nr:Mismatch repair protein msh3 [Ascosphaera pollenicola]
MGASKSPLSSTKSPSSGAASQRAPSQSQQKTISSFFRPTGPSPSLKRSAPSSSASSAVPTPAPVNSPKTADIAAAETPQPLPPNDDDQDEDIVLPAPKRVRVDHDFDHDHDHDRAKAESPKVIVTDRTERFRFSQSSATKPDDVDDNVIPSQRETQQDIERKRSLHRQFVRKLGGPDCLPSIEQGTPEGWPDEEGADEEEDVEAAAAPTAKARGGAARKTGKLTPLERQIIDIKRKHMDTILVVEVGYKFRFFGEDARVAAKELSIVCIPGKFRFDEHPSEAHLTRFASASIPVHRLHVHVKRLVAAGHKVGVVRQLETAALKAAGDNRNAPFVRKLTNLYTKGTYIDDIEAPDSVSYIEQSPNTGYLLCLTERNAKGATAQTDESVHVGILAVQPATGDIIYDDFQDGFMRSEIETRLLHIAPCEFLIVGELSPATEKLVRHLSTSKMIVFGDQVRVEHVAKTKTAEAEAHSYISSFYAALTNRGAAADQGTNSATLLDKVLGLSPIVTVCLSAMIKHMTEYGLEHVFDLTKYFQPFSARSHMLLNGNTLTNLEIYQNQTNHAVKGSLFWSMDRTRTKFGQRLLRKWIGRPLINKRALEERVTAVEELLDPEKTVDVERLRRLLQRTKSDLEKSLIRIYYGKCTRPELLALLQTLQVIASEYAHVQTPQHSNFKSSIISDNIVALPVIQQDIINFLTAVNLQAAKSDDRYNFFREAYETKDITDCKLGIASVEFELNKHLTIVAETLGKKKVSYVTVAGIEYLIEVENSPYNNKKVPASWRKISGTKKVSRFHTPEVVRYLRERDQRKEALAAACDKAYFAFLAEIAAKYQSLRDCVSALATLDALLSLAEIASQPGYVKPSYAEDARISVKQGRHPMVEQLLLDSYVPNDTELAHDKTKALLVTGPNMGGKSSYVRQVALIAIMGQIGSYVPAESAELGMLDAVYTRMGAFDNMLTGESTFMVELSETSDILKQVTPRSLVILDELGRGTSTHDGVAIAQAVLDHIVRDVGCLTLFITHYQHLTAMQRSFQGGELRNVHMSFKEEEPQPGQEEHRGLITFLYEVVSGEAHRSYGLNVARLANIPRKVLDLAAEKSAALESEVKKRQLVGLLRDIKEYAGEETTDSRKIEESMRRIIDRSDLL